MLFRSRCSCNCVLRVGNPRLRAVKGNALDHTATASSRYARLPLDSIEAEERGRGGNSTALARNRYCVSLFFPCHGPTQLDKMLDPQVWRDAATQVFFALGLGFGGVIAFSSYNKQDNNCHFDAALVSFINFFTSVLATLVVFAVLGFKANIMNEKCVVE